MAAICTSYYAKNHISSPITMPIVNVIYGFVCLVRNLNSKKMETSEMFFPTLIVKDDFKPTVVMYIIIIFIMYICNVNSNCQYLHGLYPQLHCVYVILVL